MSANKYISAFEAQLDRMDTPTPESWKACYDFIKNVALRSKSNALKLPLLCRVSGYDVDDLAAELTIKVMVDSWGKLIAAENRVAYACSIVTNSLHSLYKHNYNNWWESIEELEADSDINARLPSDSSNCAREAVTHIVFEEMLSILLSHNKPDELLSFVYCSLLEGKPRELALELTTNSFDHVLYQTLKLACITLQLPFDEFSSALALINEQHSLADVRGDDPNEVSAQIQRLKYRAKTFINNQLGRAADALLR